jgi:hypothetical protein
MRGNMVNSIALLFAVFALPAFADNLAGARFVEVSVGPVSQERSVRGVVEAIDASGQHIRLSGAEYTFSPAKVRVTNKGGKLPASSLHVGDRVQCVVVDDGVKEDVTEVWVET